MDFFPYIFVNFSLNIKWHWCWAIETCVYFLPLWVFLLKVYGIHSDTEKLRFDESKYFCLCIFCFPTRSTLAKCNERMHQWFIRLEFSIYLWLAHSLCSIFHWQSQLAIDIFLCIIFHQYKFNIWHSSLDQKF